ncbi:hypothetical protein MYX78_06395 [Acidobacteria bacterium AH-259-G07]|nr:hypothetical protein [Acidobacteria bacterium AH-259-G07]
MSRPRLRVQELENSLEDLRTNLEWVKDLSIENSKKLLDQELETSWKKLLDDLQEPETSGAILDSSTLGEFSLLRTDIGVFLISLAAPL